MIVFVAIAGEYDEANPLGVFASFEKARQCVEDSKPTYNTELLEYETCSGSMVARHYYHAKKREWEHREEIITKELI